MGNSKMGNIYLRLKKHVARSLASWYSDERVSQTSPFPKRCRTTPPQRPTKPLILLHVIIAMLVLISSGFTDTPSHQPSQYLRIGVSERGVCKITYKMLKNSGIPLSKIDPRTFNIHHRGESIPIFVKGEEDGSFGRRDYIEFFGTFNAGKTTTKDRYTDINAYMLSWGNETPIRLKYEIFDATLMDEASSELVNQTMDDVIGNMLGNVESEADVNVGALQSLSERNITFRTMLHFEEDQVSHWRFSHPKGEETDFAFWAWLDSNKRGFSNRFDLPGLATGTTVSLKMKFYGITHLDIEPDHHVILLLNGQKISDIRWDDAVEYLFMIEQLPTQIDGLPLMREKGNRIELLIPGDLGQTDEAAAEIIMFDQVFLDWFEIEYITEGYVAEGFLDARVDPFPKDTSPHLIEFHKLDSDPVEVFELSEGRVIKPFQDPQLGTRRENVYTVYFVDTLDRAKHYVVTSDKEEDLSAFVGSHQHQGTFISEQRR